MQTIFDREIGGTRPRRSRPATGNGMPKVTGVGESSCKGLSQQDKKIQLEMNNEFDMKITEE
jgi:hypothetical protein